MLGTEELEPKNLLELENGKTGMATQCLSQIFSQFHMESRERRCIKKGSTYKLRRLSGECSLTRVIPGWSCPRLHYQGPHMSLASRTFGLYGGLDSLKEKLQSRGHLHKY